MKFKNQLIKFATFKNTLILFILTLFINLYFARYFGALEHGVPDTHLFYSANTFYDLLDKYNQEELEAYSRGIIMLDFLYPIAYSLFLAFFTFRLSQKAVLSLLPFGILIFDVLENISVLTLIRLLPNRYDFFASLAGGFTLVKWIFAATSIGIALYFSIRYLIQSRYLKNEG